MAHYLTIAHVKLEKLVDKILSLVSSVDRQDPRFFQSLEKISENLKVKLPWTKSEVVEAVDDFVKKLTHLN